MITNSDGDLLITVGDVGRADWYTLPSVYNGRHLQSILTRIKNSNNTNVLYYKTSEPLPKKKFFLAFSNTLGTILALEDFANLFASKQVFNPILHKHSLTLRISACDVPIRVWLDSYKDGVLNLTKFQMLLFEAQCLK